MLKQFLARRIRMKSLFNFVKLGSLILPMTAMATNKVGNGGNVVACKNTSQTLDFYEGSVPEPSPLPSGKNIEIAQLQIEKLKDVAPELYRQYTKRLQNILTEFDLKKDIQLELIKDSHHAFKPADIECSIIQTIIRKNVVAGDEKRFVVDQKTWERLNAFQQAGLIIHEVLYEHFYKLGEKDSIKARKLNAFLFKNTITKKSFWEYIRELDIAIYP